MFCHCASGLGVRGVVRSSVGVNKDFRPICFIATRFAATFSVPLLVVSLLSVAQAQTFTHMFSFVNDYENSFGPGSTGDYPEPA